MKSEYKKHVVNRLRTARGHVEAVVRMVEDDEYCPDVMKQLAAVQGSLEKANRLVLRNHLETCVAEAMRQGHVTGVVDELMEALRYDRVATGPADGNGADGADGATEVAGTEVAGTEGTAS